MKPKALALLMTVCAGALPAQEIIFEDGEIVLIGEMIEGLAQGPDEAAEEEAETAEPTERQKKLQKLEYDRRPSKIFEAWSKAAPEAPEAPEPFEEPEPVAPQPAVAEETEAESPEQPQEEAESPEEPGEPKEEPKQESEEVDPAIAAAQQAFEEAKAAWEESKQEAEAAQKTYETEQLEWELESLQRNVSIGDWAAVAAYFESLTEEEGKAGFERMIESLAKGPPKKEQVPQQGQRHREKNQFSPADVVGLMGTAPLEPSRENLTTLGEILSQALEAGHQLDTFLQEIEAGLDLEESPLNRRQAALLVAGAGREVALEKLLPKPDEAEAADDREGLNLLSRYYLASHADDGKTEWLEQAWRTTQAVLAVGEVDEEQKKEAIQRAVAIAPKIRDELGQAWLDESFTERPERGMEILAAIGAETSKALSMVPTDQEARFRLLELQTTTANTLLQVAPELASDWKVQLELLGANWLREALVSYELDDSTSMGPSMQRDVFGNFFYYDYRSSSRGNAPQPIRTWQLLEIRPGDAWIEQMGGTLRPRFQMMYAKLMLKVGEEAPAFPYIEQLATSLPDQAEELVSEFLRVWTRNHDPNSESRRSSRYIYFYGFERRAEGIPLTRSKQERNLAELAEWVARLRELPVELDDELVATAFKTAHSSAEIYRLETIERIFGSMAALEPATLAGLVQTMRSNLTDVWRDPAVQKEKGTKRRKKDIQAEVDRGYQLASETLDRALEDHPQSWELWLAKASIQHDHNNYKHELAKDVEFSQRRQASFEVFAQAAELYASTLAGRKQDEESVQVYDTWFYAALGACDLDAVRPEMQLAEGQIDRIQEALDALPEDRAERHVDKFASSFFSRMSSVNPALKFRYLREGLRITGDNKLAREAHSVFEYYNDLVTEIQLVIRVDGSDRVGHAQPFGLQVDLRHTREIERESGGFTKYLQNQQNQRFGYNYGRPLENYRDKFEETVRERLNEHFDVLSVTFNDPETRSRADEEYGWRVTPYAYLLLQPRGPEIDRVPALSLDLDFLDTSGYAVLPIESAALPLDAANAAGDPRPYEELAVTQTLDERQVDRGKLIVEAKATARGLLPDFDALFELQPEGFEIAAVEDQGVSVVQFHEDGHGVLSERNWTVTMQAAEGLAELPSQFSFATPRVEAESVEQYRYDDADLVAVESTVDLIESWGKKDRGGLWRVALGLVVLGAAAVLGLRWMKRPQATVESRFRMPERLTPFTVLGLLREISSGNGLAPADHAQLAREIEQLEQHYFVEERAGGVDLRRVAESWLERAT